MALEEEHVALLYVLALYFMHAEAFHYIGVPVHIHAVHKIAAAHKAGAIYAERSLAAPAVLRAKVLPGKAAYGVP